MEVQKIKNLDAANHEPASSVEHLASALFGSCNLETVWLAMLKGWTGYFDASGDEARPDAMTVGGFVARPRDWSKFHCDWRGVLSPLGIDVFHMKEFRLGLQGKATDWNERQRILCRLAQIICWRTLHSPASTVRLADWNQVNDEYRLSDCHATPYAMASLLCILKTFEAAEAEGLTTDDVEFVFEKGDTGQGNLTWFLDRVVNDQIKLKGIKAKPVEPAFKSKSRDLSMLQAADFAAWEQRNAVANEQSADEWSAPLSVLLQKFAKQWGVVSIDQIREQAEKIEIPKRSVAWGPREREKWRPTLIRQEPSSSP